MLDRCGPYFSLTVPGLSEGRPSLLIGDRIIVCEHSEDGTYYIIAMNVHDL